MLLQCVDFGNIRPMKSRFVSILAVSLLLQLAVGCASSVHVAKTPLQVSHFPDQPLTSPVSIGVVRLPRPIQVGHGFGSHFEEQLAESMENGMLTACRLINPMARFLETSEPGQVDWMLVPSNPFFETGKSGYSVKVTVSVDVEVIRRGCEKPIGMLVEATGTPGGPRPAGEAEILGRRFGLIGWKNTGTPIERALNHSLFEFSLHFAEKLESRIRSYAQLP
jgi:hypothetical protein